MEAVDPLMTDLGLLAMIAGLLVLGTNLLSYPLEKSLLSRPLLGLLLGIALGPEVAGTLSLAAWGIDPHRILLEATKLTLIISVVGVALRLPAGYFSRHWRSMTAVLSAGMLGMCATGSVLIHLGLGITALAALLAGAIVTPTDPVLASSIVEGKVARDNLPERLRNVLLAESGANDGLALPLVMLFALLITEPASQAGGHWLVQVVLWETLVAALAGLGSGYLIGAALRTAEGRGYLERAPLLGTTLALSLLAFGAAEWLQLNPILMAFTAGLGFDRGAEASEQRDVLPVQDAINNFFSVPVFLLFGLALPYEGWMRHGWTLPAAALAVLLLRRLPTWLLLYRAIASIKDRRELLFCGWFGPVGVAALYYSLHVRELTGDALYWTFTSFVVTLSIFLHGVTATPLARLMSRDEPDLPGAERGGRTSARHLA